jgi:hypothetical protein
MKTTIEIDDVLLAEARRLANERKTTLRALVEQGLRRVIDERTAPEPFKLRDCSVAGGWLAPEFQNASWTDIIDASYEGRGG